MCDGARSIKWVYGLRGFAHLVSFRAIKTHTMVTGIAAISAVAVFAAKNTRKPVALIGTTRQAA